MNYDLVSSFRLNLIVNLFIRLYLLIWNILLDCNI